MDKRRYMEDDVCWHAFKYFDTDGSGTLDREEIMRLMVRDDVNDIMQVSVNEKEVDIIMKDVDLNGDGKIDFDEFMVMMSRMPSSSVKETKSNEDRQTNTQK